jgi:uncharacterized protein (TIGR03437 family)
MLARRLAFALVLPFTFACSDDDPTNGGGGPASIAIQGGDQQDGAAGSILALPLEVKVTDAANDPVAGVVVIFRPAAGSGVELSDTIVTTGLTGIAGVTVRVGQQLGEYNIARAFLRASPGDEVTFDAEVTPGPTLASITPTNVQAGDTVTLTGTGFNTVATGNAVLFGTTRALITSSSGTQLEAVVPPCVTPGTVPVRVEVGTAATAPTNVTYASTAFLVDLTVNEGITVSGAEVADCLRLPGNGAGYLVVPQFATGISLPTTAFQIGNSASPLVAQRLSDQLDVLVRQSARTAQSRFDLALRSYERTMPVPNLADITQPPALEALTLNSQRTFRVLCSIEVDETCFQTVTARLKFIGSNVLVYIDNAAPANGFTDQELQDFGAVFDETLYPIDVSVFGSESDIDNNDGVIMLLTPVVNALVDAADCQQFGSVLGFFFGFDLSSQSTDSNKGEVFYGFVPDPEAQFSCAHSKQTVARVLPGTFIHEFQHMINYNQHVLVRGGGSQETDWLNEGLSHMAEEMASLHYERKFPPPSGRTNPNQIFPDSSQGFITEQLGNSYDYLANSRTSSLTLFETGECCEGRGASWLFMRYLGDQFDSTVFARLVQTRLTSIANVENATGRSFASLFGDFGIAVYVDSLADVPRSAIPDRYRFTTRNLRYLYDALFRALPSSFPQPFPIVPTVLGHTQQLSSSMEPGTSAYYELSTPAGSGPVSLRFAPATGTFDPLLQAQLGVFRLR